MVRVLAVLAETTDLAREHCRQEMVHLDEASSVTCTLSAAALRAPYARARMQCTSSRNLKLWPMAWISSPRPYTCAFPHKATLRWARCWYRSTRIDSGLVTVPYYGRVCRQISMSLQNMCIF